MTGRPLQEPPPCGTQRAYWRHTRHGEPTCQPCRDAHAEYQRERRAKITARRKAAGVWGRRRKALAAEAAEQQHEAQRPMVRLRYPAPVRLRREVPRR